MAYISSRGHRALRQELSRLLTQERPKVVQEVADAAAQGDRSENAEYKYGKKRLREIDRRAGYIGRRLDQATVIDLTAESPSAERVYFGAIVTLTSDDQPPRTVQILGPDEVDTELGVISYQSPLGRALMRRSLGECFVFRPPRGELELEIAEIRYNAWLPDEIGADSDRPDPL